MHSKLAIREAIHELHNLGLEGSLEKNAFDSEGRVYHEEVLLQLLEDVFPTCMRSFRVLVYVPAFRETLWFIVNAVQLLISQIVEGRVRSFLQFAAVFRLPWLPCCPHTTQF